MKLNFLETSTMDDANVSTLEIEMPSIEQQHMILTLYQNNKAPLPFFMLSINCPPHS